jgi:hypothetical protein
MTNKFIAILLIVMVCIADASPLLKQWSNRQQQSLKSGAANKAGLQHSTVTIQLKSPRSGGRGRKLSLADPIATVVNNLVLGTGQANIECKALDKALKAGHLAAPNTFYHADLAEFAQAWRDVYNVDITAAVCVGKLHSIEISGGQANPQIPQICVGFNKLTTSVCPTYTTEFCAQYRTEKDGTNDAAIVAAHVLNDVNNEQYEDLYSLRLIEGGGTQTTWRKYYATTRPTAGGKIAAGCPGLSMGLAYNDAASSSADPGHAGVNLAIEAKIYEEDLIYYNVDGTANSNQGLPKKYAKTVGVGGGLECTGVFEAHGASCFKILNTASDVLPAVGVLFDGRAATSTSGKYAGDSLADVDDCPGLNRPRQTDTGRQGSAATPTCSISEFAALVTGETVNGASGDCIRRIYTDLCTTFTPTGHDQQLTGSDVNSGKATYTKPLLISLAAGEYCDGADPATIGACSLSRQLEQDFNFELSCEQIASQMTSTGTHNSHKAEAIRSVAITWTISPLVTALLKDRASDQKIMADFHCTGAETVGLCGAGKIGASHACHGLIRNGCANPDYTLDIAGNVVVGTTYYAGTPTGIGGANVVCEPSQDLKVEAWKKAVGLEGTFRGTLNGAPNTVALIADIYNELACHSLRDDVNIDGAEAIFQKCASLEAELAKVRITYATEYLLHDAQAVKKDKLSNFEKHINSYTVALAQTCNSNFGDINPQSDLQIKALKSSPTSLSLEQQLIAAATTPEDVAINVQRTKLDQRIRELEESIALIKSAHDGAAISGVDVAPTIAKFEKIVKTILSRLAVAYRTIPTGDGSTGLAPMETQAACPHLAAQLDSLALESYLHTSVGQVAIADSSLPITLNDGSSKTLTNLVNILKHTIAFVTLGNQAGTSAQRTVDLKAGLQKLVVETAEYCLWESQDRYDRCETCAARQQLYADTNIYRQVAAEITTLSGYNSELATLEAASCLAPVMSSPGVQASGGVGNQARKHACSIPAQGVLSSLAGIDGAASYIKGYPSTGYDNPSTTGVETDHPHPQYSSSTGGTLYDKTTFANHLSECIGEISLTDIRGCPAQTSGDQAQTQLALSSTQKTNLEAKAVGASSTFEVKRAHCISALDVVLADTSLAYDCAVSAPNNAACVDGAITHFVKQCEKTDGSAYAAHASPHSGAHNIGPNGPGIFQSVRAYARAEDAYDTAKKARMTLENDLNIDPSELKNLKDDVKSAQTYKNVIEKHIASLNVELSAFTNRHATVVTKCDNLVSAKVAAKVQHAVELRKYDFEEVDLINKKNTVNDKTYDASKTALDEYCAQVSAVKDAVTIASLADVNSIVRAGLRCNTSPSYDNSADAQCCQADARTVNARDIGHADFAADSRPQDCIAAEQALAASQACTQTDAAAKATCISNILSNVGSGLGGACVYTKANGLPCSLNDDCTSGICRDTTYTGDTSTSKECGAFLYAASGGACGTVSGQTETILCKPFGSVRLTTTHSAPSGAAVNAATGKWTQVCNSAGTCSDLALGEKNQECATAQSLDGHSGDTCNAGLSCDLASVNARGAQYDVEEYDSSGATNSVGKDICIPSPQCNDDIQNGQETGIDCGSAACTHQDECIAGTASGYAVDAACTFHSDCASGAACTQQYVYKLSDGTICNPLVVTDGTCTQVASGKKCKDPQCTGSKPVPNLVFGQVVQCAGSSTATDPYEHEETLHTFTVNGITFKYYVETWTQTQSECETAGGTWANGACSGGRRRLLSSPTGTYDFAQYGKKFRSAPMPNQHDRTQWFKSVKANALKSHKLKAASDLAGCRAPRTGETGGDQAEFATHLDCSVNNDCTSGSCVSNRCSEGNSAYSQSGLPDIDVLNVCDSDGVASNGYSHVKGSYATSVLDKYGYSVGSGLQLASRRGHSRQLRATRQRNKLSTFHQRLKSVTDPSGGFLFPQADNLRDCTHDNQNFCSFSSTAHVNIAGFCSATCSDCKTGQCAPCATTTDCEMCGVVAGVPAALVDPACVDLWAGSYTSQAACVLAEDVDSLCIKTHECTMTAAVAGNAGYKCLPSCVAPGAVRKVDASCKNIGEAGNDCEDKSSQPTIKGQCETPASAQTCAQLGNCAIGGTCTADTHCDGSLVCSSGACAAAAATACSYTIGKSIDDMTVAEIKAAFVTGTSAANVAINTGAETTAIAEEKNCVCNQLESIAKTQGGDQAIIDQMNSRISELQTLIADGSGTTTEGSANKAVRDAEEKLRLYLTNTASGAQDIATRTTAEATADTARATARAVALQVAAPSYLDYYKNVVANAAFTGSAREDAYALYAQLAQGAPACDGYNAVACQSLAGDVNGEDDTYLDELHRIFAACQSASDEKEGMRIANEAAGIAKSAAAVAAVVDGAGVALNIADCVVKSTAEYDNKKLYDDKKAQIAVIDASLLSKNYVKAGDIVKKHKHYSCCSGSLGALEGLERCAVTTDCSYGGNCIGHFCVPEPCLCAPNMDTTSVSYNTADFPIDDDDCDIAGFSAFCGDGTCDASEDKTSCAADCRCGDGTCANTYIGQFAAGENCINCAADCGSQTTYVLAGTSTACPADIHADNVCGCYPDSSGTLNCETLSHTADCNCARLCNNYVQASPFGSSSQVGLTAATASNTCARVADCTSAWAIDSATASNVIAFCLGLDSKFEVGASVNSQMVWGRIKTCGVAAATGVNEVHCPEESYSTAAVPIVPGGNLPNEYRCAPLAKGYLAACQPDSVTGVIPYVDFSSSLRRLDTATDAGLVANCESIGLLTGISNAAQKASLGRWAKVRTLSGQSALPVCEIGVTKVDDNCYDWSLSLGCPASCSCPTAVQPVYDSTAAVSKGTVTKAEVAASLCGLECTCGGQVLTGMTADVTGNLYSTTCFNTCPAVCADATSDALSACHIAGSNGQKNNDINNGLCDDPSSAAVPSRTYGTTTNTYTADWVGSLYGGVCQDLCDCGSAANGWVPTGDGRGNPLSRTRHGRKLHGACTGSELGGADPDCSAITQSAMTQLEWEAQVGACYFTNQERVHKFYCEANGGVQAQATGCTAVAYAHAEIAHDGASDECYGLNGYVSGVVDSLATPAAGCRDALGVLTGVSCYYGDGTNCVVGDSIAKANTVVAPVVSNTPTGHVQTDGSRVGGNQICDAAEDKTSCPSDCRCGDGVCGLDAKGVSEVGACDVDCVFHCYDAASGGCYNFAVNDFGTNGIGQWNPTNGHDKSFASFSLYCGEWAGNGGSNAYGSSSIVGTTTAGKGSCPPGTTGRRRLLMEKGETKMDALKEWAKTGVKGLSNYASKSFKSLVDKVKRRRKLLGDIKPTDRRTVDTGGVPWLVSSAASFDAQEALCLGSQHGALDAAILLAFTNILGPGGLNQADKLIASEAAIDAAILSTSSVDGIDLVLGSAIASLNAELARKQSQDGDCSASEKAIVHNYAATWVPVTHCYPLKFIETHGTMATSSSCVEMAEQALSSVAARPLPGTVEGGTDSYKLAVREGFLSLTAMFKYQTYTDQADVTSQCTATGSLLCSSESATSRGSGGSCLSAVSSGFPARQSCVNEYRKNLADIALWLDTSALGFTGSSSSTDVVGNVVLDAFKTQHVAILGAGTENALNKLKALRILIGDKDAAAVTISDSSTVGTIQGCWEAYENKVGYANELTWLTVSGALNQAVNAVKKEEQAIIQVHADAKAECKEHCVIDDARDKWSTLEARCTGAPSRCKCRRDVEPGYEAADKTSQGLAPVKCNCMFDSQDPSVIGDTSLQNYNGVGVEDCQVEPAHYIAGIMPYSYDGTDADSDADKDLALVYGGESPTAIAESKLSALIAGRKTDILQYVTVLSANLATNLGDAGLLGQQQATSVKQVCQVMNHEVGGRDNLQLSDANAMDDFFGNYINQIQAGTVESATATRRLASEPCSLCD